MELAKVHIEASEAFAAILAELQAGNVDAAVRLAARGKRIHRESATFHELRNATPEFRRERSEGRRKAHAADDYARDYEAREMRALIGE